MASLLHVDCSPVGDRSVSRHLSSEYTRAWRAANPGAPVVRRDLCAGTIPFVDAAWIAAAYTPKEARTAEHHAKLALSDELLGELRGATHWVFGVPMYNFSVPATMKAYIDQIVRVGETFAYGANGPVGLIEGKSATFLMSSGGSYGAADAARSMNFVEPYLRAVFGFLGVTAVDTVAAGGTAALRAPGADLEAFLEPHLRAIRARFAA